MRFMLVLIAGLLPILSSPTVAQEAGVRETRCWAGDVTFSAGMGINVGDSTAVCEAGSGWKTSEADSPVAGCLLEGKLSSIGAVIGIRNNDNLLLECGDGGRWTMIDADRRS